MPDSHAGGRRVVADAGRLVRRWLGEFGKDAVRSLTRPELSLYDGHSIVAGWRVVVSAAGRNWPLFVLLPAGFPFAPPRIALADDKRYLEWPHIEDLGLFCLPSEPAAPDDPVDTVQRALDAACVLIEQCHGSVDDDEFRKEFLSYWARGVPDKARPVRSLLDASNETVRRIFVWYGALFSVVADSEEQLLRWCEHTGVKLPKGYSLDHGLLIGFSQAPVPADYPRSVDSLRQLITRYAPRALPQFEALFAEHERALVIFTASSDTGRGLGAVAVTYGTKISLPGFRKGTPDQVQRAARLAQATAAMRRVDRIDPAWVHGRGLNADQPTLYGRTVALLGCGAVGSLVGMRLAQAGVGAFITVDPQVLEAQNTSRHALGAQDVGSFKAAALAREITRRFPHIRAATPFAKNWLSLTPTELELIAKADLIVSAMGEWAGEGPLNEWHQAHPALPPIVYGWTEDHATAGHAVLVAAGRPGCLHCILNADGSPRAPETVWPEGATLRPEPACGASFQPFGSVELASTEALVADLCLDTLLGKATSPAHRVYATSTLRLTSVKGVWSDSHLALRPSSFDGAGVFTRFFEPRIDCPVCSQRK
jgi:molybdopterin/thiamine biosynthesis adenylyltransferase